MRSIKASGSLWQRFHQRGRWLLKHRPYLLLIAILLFAFVTRVWRLNVPEKYVFDEVYHAVTAKLIARNDPWAFEWWNPPPEPNTAVDWLHPPLAKYTQAFFIKIFGETSFGWRLSSALFGVGVVGLVYWLAKELFQDQATALLAALIASLDGLLLVQSRIAMNDIHVTFFILLTLSCYWRFVSSKTQNVGWLLATGVAAGLAISSKWSGVFVLGVLGLSEAVRLLPQLPPRTAVITWLRDSLRSILALLCIPIVVYLLSYSQMFLQGKDWNHFVGLHQQIWWYQTTLDATHQYQSRPWQWFLDVRPVWYWVDYVDDTHIANIYALGNPLIFWLGAAALVLVTGSWLVVSLDHFKVVKVRSRRWLLTEVKKWYPAWSFLVLAYLLVWLPWQFSPRIMFFYHYTPGIALLIIILARVLNGLSSGIRLGLLLLIMAFFAIWYPQWTGLTVPKSFADRVYFGLIKSWK